MKRKMLIVALALLTIIVVTLSFKKTSNTLIIRASDLKQPVTYFKFRDKSGKLVSAYREIEIIENTFKESVNLGYRGIPAGQTGVYFHYPLRYADTVVYSNSKIDSIHVNIFGSEIGTLHRPSKGYFKIKYWYDRF